MLNKKLFKKLNEQMEINRVLNEEISDAEREAVEQKVIFENANKELMENLDKAENSEVEE